MDDQLTRAAESGPHEENIPVGDSRSTPPSIDDPAWRPEWAMRYAHEAVGQWEAAHHRLIARLRKECQEHINRILAKLRSELGAPYNGWAFERLHGPRQVVIDAEGRLKQLQDQAQSNRTAREKLRDIHLTTTLAHDLKQPSVQDWWHLVAILGICIAIEAGANSFLLASALTTGLVGAFVTAILVSVLNVGALGAGVGLLLSSFRRRTDRSGIFYGSVGTWAILTLLLNLLVGRHREAFARIIDEREQQVMGSVETNFSTVTETAASIPYIPSSWQFESLLFFCLGVALCAFGFYKGYSFIKTIDPNRAKYELDKQRARILKNYWQLSDEFRRQLTNNVRADVAGWVQELKTEWHHATDQLEDLESEWNGRSHLAHVEALFVSAYNDVSATKINKTMLRTHRDQEDFMLSFPMSPADRQVLSDTKEILQKWSTTDMEVFFADINERTQAVDSLWTNYKRLVVNVLEERKENPIAIQSPTDV